MIQYKKRLQIFKILIFTSILFNIIFGSLFFVDIIIKRTAAVPNQIIVDQNGNGNYLRIQDAIDNASYMDTIFVRDGIYYENLIINKRLNLIGNSNSTTIINGQDSDDVITIIVDFVTFMNFKILNSESQEYISQDYVGIKLNRVIECSIQNSIFMGHNYGIYLEDSKYNNIENNTCSFNNIGISLYLSKENDIKNNKCDFNNATGIEIKKGSSMNTIIGNTCSNNHALGIIINEFSINNSIINNQCYKNQYRIEIIQSNSNHLINNSCYENEKGIVCYSSKNNLITSNNIKNNNEGLEFYNVVPDSQRNNCSEKNCRNINQIEQKDYNIVSMNNITNNKYGITIFNSNNNTIRKNSISNNYYGLYLSLDFDSININSFYNRFYHNCIISNKIQVIDNGTNYWDNNQGEGNYWSDYKGIDDGSNNHEKDDRIGDTLIPHLDFDFYPYVIPYGWLYPDKPILKDPGKNNDDGDYFIYWERTNKTLGYILEEDHNLEFKAPSIIYNGKNNFYNISSKNL